MSATTSIEWTDATWNPIRGCTRVSEGCRNCYAEAMAARFSRPGQWGHGIAEMRDGQPRWTGRVDVVDDALTLPLRWRKPRRIFVNSISDLFHESVPDEAIDRVFAVMALCPQHTFIVLTKRSARMRAYMTDPTRAAKVWAAVDDLCERWAAGELGVICLSATEDGDAYLPALIAQGARWGGELPWPLRNVHMGVSVEDQPTADARIPDVLATPAAVRIVSAEPLLGPIDFVRWLPICRVTTCHPDREKTVELLLSKKDGHHLDQVIVGGESGPNARPMHPAWPRAIRDQCIAGGVPFFFKQWGEWSPRPLDQWCAGITTRIDDIGFERVGKKRAGRLLDGRTWDETPFTRS